jgi:hypothetical protein
VEFLGCQTKVQRDVVDDYSLAVGNPFQVCLTICARHFGHFLNKKFLHRVKIASLCLPWDPLEAVPEELISTIIVFLGSFGLVLDDEVWVRGHAVFFVLFVAFVLAVTMAVIATAAVTSMSALLITAVVGPYTQ